MSSPKYSASRPQGQEHIPIYPKGFVAIRIVQLVLALVVIALAAYGLYYLPFDGNSFILAVGVMTLVSSIYHLIVEFGVPAGYNYWAILGLDIFFIVMWLCAFALLAARVAPGFGYQGYSCNYAGRCTLVGLSSGELGWLATQAAAAGIGGLEFVLYIVSLVIHSIRLHQHRAAGLHCMPGTPPSAPSGGSNGAVVPGVVYGNGKVGGPVPLNQQQQQQQQQQYVPHPQQPIPAYPQQQQQQQFYQPYAGMPQQQMPPQQHHHQQQQQQPTFYAPVPQHVIPQQQPPQPTGTPAPLVPQPTGDSYTPSSLASQGHQQQQQHQQQLPQLPGNDY